ncbi:MAG: nucleotidyltransferase domain-containing protein [Chromatiales bacterium]|nr:nucleotidyltransferase domain-containing protein [Chromatiales bacterium]
MRQPAPIDDRGPAPTAFAPAAVAVPRHAARRAAATATTASPPFRQALRRRRRQPAASASPTTSRSRRWCATARAWSTSCCASAWALHAGAARARTSTLVAVGGYGRGELHPCSDIDVLILLPKSEVVGGRRRASSASSRSCGTSASRSATACARIDDCQRESAADVSVATTLIEARLLAGPDYLFQAMRRALGAGQRSGRRRPFFEAKVAEQQARHHRYHDTGLQPRAERQGEPGRPARHPDHRLGRQAALRRRDARRAGRRTASSPPTSCASCGTAQAFLLEGALRAARHHRPARGPAAVRPPDPHREACSATRTRPTRSRSSSSCSATTAPSWT